MIVELKLRKVGNSVGVVLPKEALESAFSKPRNRLAYGSPTLAKMAARYAAGTVLNHPFLDGNKRTGFMLAATFLELNGMEFAATEESVVEMTLALAGGKVREVAYAKWLSENSSKA